MKAKTMVLLAAASAYVVLFAVTPVAEAPGLGVCVVGNGFSLTDDNAPFVGVNAGTVQPGAYDNLAGFEAACCAETSQPPDCFDDV